MEIVIENNFLRVTINSFGAELASVVKKETTEEMLWCADKAVWNRHAPILFPYCGKLKDGAFTHKGVTYFGGQHGFARDVEHTLLEQRNSVAVFTLAANAVTMDKFPFVFRLTTTYRLEGQRIRHEVLVENEGDWAMPFSLGYHPAFACPFDEQHETEDYVFRFDTPQSPLEVDTSSNGLINGKAKPLFDNKTDIQLTDELFAADSICMKNLNAKTLSIVERDSGRAINVSIEGFPYTLIWSATGKIKFVCIEPWHGLPDDVNASGEWSEKPDNIVLEKGEAWSTAIAMEFAR